MVPEFSKLDIGKLLLAGVLCLVTSHSRDRSRDLVKTIKSNCARLSAKIEGGIGSMRAILPQSKNGEKPKSELNEIELSYCHHSIFLKNRALRKSISQNIWPKWSSICTEYARFHFCA